MNPLALAAAALALVAEDGTALRSAPNDAATAQAILYRGDWLEVRGEAPGFLKVWDHRRERGGYIRPAAVRVHQLPLAEGRGGQAAAGGSARGSEVAADGATGRAAEVVTVGGAPGRAAEVVAAELAAVVRFLRDSVGFESLGIAYAAFYIKVAPADRGPQQAEVLAALGEMAERLGRRASGVSVAGGVPVGRAPDSVLAGQVAVAEGYGVGFRRFDRGARTVVCYDGDAFMRVLQVPAATPELQARAALSLTRRGCLDPSLTATERRAWNEARLQVLAAVDRALDRGSVPATWAYRLRLRGAEALAEKAHDEAAQSRPKPAARAAGESLRRLALVDRGRLAPEDLTSYEETAVRVAAVRWLAEPPPSRRPALALEIAPARPGETCVRLRPTANPGVVPGAAPAPPARAPASFVERCTYGVVLASSLRVAPSGKAAALAVAPLPGWTEL